MILEHNGIAPRIAPSARVAANATICGDVTIGAGCSVGFGAVLTAESGPIVVGAHCVIMENAVLRGVKSAPLTIGDHVLIGPHAHLSGCTVEDEAFVATGASVFNLAVIGKGAEVRIGGVVHIRTVLPPGETVPINWVAVGNPAQIFPPDRHDEIWAIQKTLEFPKLVFGVERPQPGAPMMPTAMRRYSRRLGRHRDDREIG